MISPEIHYHTGWYTPHKIVLPLLGAGGTITSAFGALALLHRDHLLNFWPQIGTLSQAAADSLLYGGGAIAVASLITAGVFVIKHFRERQPLIRFFKDFQPSRDFAEVDGHIEAGGRYDNIIEKNLYWVSLSTKEKKELHFFIDQGQRDSFKEALPIFSSRQTN